MRFAVITACIVFLCIGCQSTPNRCPEVLPIQVLEAEPSYEGDISLESDDAAIRYIAIAEQLFDNIWGPPYYLDVYEHGIDHFVAYSNEADEVASEEYKQWLTENEHWLMHIEEAVRIGKYRAYVPAKIYGEQNEDDLFLRSTRSIRSISSMLEDDAVRLWAQGHTVAAIHRIDLMIRIATHPLQSSAATAITGLNTNNTVDQALAMFDQMLSSSRCGAEELALIRESVHTVEGDDPTEILRLVARDIASLHSAMEDWFEVEGGSYELWVLVGKHIGAMAAIQPILDAFDTAIEVAFEGKEVEDGTDPFKWPPDIDLDTVTNQALSELIGLEFEGLKTTFESSSGDVELVIEELCSGKPDLDVLYAIQKRCDLDDSPISTLLFLQGAHSIAKRHARMIETRDRVIASCEAE